MHFDNIAKPALADFGTWLLWLLDAACILEREISVHTGWRAFLDVKCGSPNLTMVESTESEPSGCSLRAYG